MDMLSHDDSPTTPNAKQPANETNVNGIFRPETPNARTRKEQENNVKKTANLRPQEIVPTTNVQEVEQILCWISYPSYP